jgi:hypothetical protein
MKTYLLSLLLISLLCFISCDFGLTGDEDEDLTELEKLPPLTTTGENTFGYLLNDQAINVKNTLRITALYQHGQLQLGGGVSNLEKDIDITILLSDPLMLNKKYSLKNTSKYVDFNIFSTCTYEFEETYEGSLNFVKIDRINFILSGTFEFSTVTEGCDTVNITGGRFDVQYTP